MKTVLGTSALIAMAVCLGDPAYDATSVWSSSAGHQGLDSTQVAQSVEVWSGETRWIWGTNGSGVIYGVPAPSVGPKTNTGNENHAPTQRLSSIGYDGNGNPHNLAGGSLPGGWTTQPPSRQAIAPRPKR